MDSVEYLEDEGFKLFCNQLEGSFSAMQEHGMDESEMQEFVGSFTNHLSQTPVGEEQSFRKLVGSFQQKIVTDGKCQDQATFTKALESFTDLLSQRRGGQQQHLQQSSPKPQQRRSRSPCRASPKQRSLRSLPSTAAKESDLDGFSVSVHASNSDHKLDLSSHKGPIDGLLTVNLEEWKREQLQDDTNNTNTNTTVYSTGAPASPGKRKIRVKVRAGAINILNSPLAAGSKLKLKKRDLMDLTPRRSKSKQPTERRCRSKSRQPADGGSGRRRNRNRSVSRAAADPRLRNRSKSRGPQPPEAEKRRPRSLSRKRMQEAGASLQVPFQDDNNDLDDTHSTHTRVVSNRQQQSPRKQLHDSLKGSSHHSPRRQGRRASTSSMSSSMHTSPRRPPVVSSYFRATSDVAASKQTGHSASDAAVPKNSSTGILRTPKPRLTGDSSNGDNSLSHTVHVSKDIAQRRRAYLGEDQPGHSSNNDSSNGEDLAAASSRQARPRAKSLVRKLRTTARGATETRARRDEHLEKFVNKRFVDGEEYEAPPPPQVQQRRSKSAKPTNRRSSV